MRARNGNPHEHWWGRNRTGSRCEIGDTDKFPNCIEEDVIAARTEEGCTTYNMHKLARHLFRWSGASKFMDYYELTFFSSLLSHINGEDGRKLYYLPLGVLPQARARRSQRGGLLRRDSPLLILSVAQIGALDPEADDERLRAAAQARPEAQVQGGGPRRVV